MSPPLGRLSRPAVLIWLILAAAAARAEEGLLVRILEPADGGYVSGRSFIVAEVDVPETLSLERVEFEVNGRITAALESPPWRVMHDFGRTYEAWFIRVKAVASDGRTAVASVSTRPLTIHDTGGVDLVSVFATVQDARGRYVMTLDSQDFVLLEDGRRQQIRYFSKERLPLAIQILIDTSLSMEGRSIEEARRAASGFLDALAPEDRVGVIAFSDDVQVLHPLEPDRQAAKSAIGRATARGGTALYDAVAEAARMLADVSDRDIRRAVILLSDGRDEAASGLTPGSVLTFEESLTEVVQSNVILYAIGLGRGLDRQLDFYQERSLEQVLTTMAEETGGRAYFAPRAERLKNAYGEIETELRHHYTLAYDSTNDRRDGSWRRIDLRTLQPGHTVRARRGYYAPDEDVLR